MLDIGNWGGLLIRGGYTAPPAPPAAAAAADPARLPVAPRAPRLAAFDSVCWGVEPWDTKKVEAELKKRGLNPVADHKGDFQSFHVKDPDGFGLQISNGNRDNRRKGAASCKVSAPAPFANTNWRTVWLDHISFEASNYKETAAFYHALLGWKLGRGRGQPELAATSATSAASSSGAAIAGRPARHRSRGGPRSGTSRSASAIRSGRGESRTRKARAERTRRHRRSRRDPHRSVQELPHHHAERVRLASQRDDSGDPRRVTRDDETHRIEVMRDHAGRGSR